jgi:hypothetical protein
MVAACLSACASEIVYDEGRDDADGAGRSGPGEEDGGAGGGGPERLPAYVAFQDVHLLGSDHVEGTAVAYFDARVGHDPCTHQEVGACRFARCPAGYSTHDVPSADAGDLTLTTPFPLEDYVVDRQEGYLFWSPDRAIFANGDVLGAAFSGAVVPSFADSVPAPLVATDFDPPLDSFVFLSRGGHHLTWRVEGTGGGMFVFSIRPTPPDDPGSTLKEPYQSLDCAVPASDGALDIPAEAMNLFDPMQTGALSIWVGTSCGKEVIVGDWRVGFQADDLHTMDNCVLY